MTKTILTSILLLTILVFQGISASSCSVPSSPQAPTQFNGDIAYQHVTNQMKLGMRIPGTPAHADAIRYISDELSKVGWTVEIQETSDSSSDIQNIVATRGDAATRVVLGAHYDTREYADRDSNPDNRTSPVPGANDGASGVAVLLEIARVLPQSVSGVTLLFIDAEDQGDINGQQWIRGASFFVDRNFKDPSVAKPQAAIIIDMIGDADLNLYYENNSDQKLREEIWSEAAGLGYSDQFIPQGKYTMIDDHIPFKNAGIPAVDMIDFDYPYWHTTADTADKVSAQSLEAVGRTLIAWLESGKP